MEKINLIYTIAGIYGEIFDHYPSINERTKVRNMAKSIFDDLVKQNEIFVDGKFKQRIESYFNSIIDNISKIMQENFNINQWIEHFF